MLCSSLSSFDTCADGAVGESINAAVGDAGEVPITSGRDPGTLEETRPADWEDSVTLDEAITGANSFRGWPIGRQIKKSLLIFCSPGS